MKLHIDLGQVDPDSIRRVTVDTMEAAKWAADDPGPLGRTRYPVAMTGEEVSIQVAPGAHSIEASGHTSDGRNLYAHPTGLIDIPASGTSVHLALRPKIDWLGRIERKTTEAGTALYLALSPDGSDELAPYGRQANGQPSFWIHVDAQGRYRVQCPTGSYELWVGTRAELQAGEPRRRIPTIIE